MQCIVSASLCIVCTRCAEDGGSYPVHDGILSEPLAPVLLEIRLPATYFGQLAVTASDISLHAVFTVFGKMTRLIEKSPRNLSVTVADFSKISYSTALAEVYL